MTSGDPWGLAGRVVVVTGGTRGIGAALSRGIAQAGASVAVMAKDADRLRGFVDELAAESPAPVLGVPADVADETSVESAFATIAERLGPVDGLVNNAGITKVGPSLDYDLADWRRIQETNVTGLFACTREAVRRMGERPASIVNVASLSSFVGQPQRAAYVASKSAVLGITRSLAVEWGPTGVRVNAIAPGYILTDLTRDLLDRGVIRQEPIVGRTPLRRWGTPEDLVGAVLFLLSDHSAFVSGATLSVDGGWLANGYFE